MIQGGDPTGTGRGGESRQGKPFNDEPNSKLLLSGRGVVSMANSGYYTNGSQFFILFKSANHLNLKHNVFGGVIGGLTTLSAMETVPVDDNDKPLVQERQNPELWLVLETGKYLKTRNSQTESTVVDTNITAISVTKKRKTAPGEFKDLSAW